MIKDLPEGSTITNRDKRRFDHLIPNFLCRYIKKTDKICSVGCGSGYDVEVLNRLGYDAYGFDPGSRTKAWDERSALVRSRLKMGMASDFPFGKEQFDFVYSLEVIEHVGCVDGVWKLLDNYKQIRTEFLEDCLDLLKPNGSLLLTVANRLFPIDVGHGHHYHWLTDCIFNKTGIRVTIPWHPKNFLLSFSDIKDLLLGTTYNKIITIRLISCARFLAFSSCISNSIKSRILRIAAGIYYRIASATPLRKTFFNPFLIVKVQKKMRK